MKLSRALLVAGLVVLSAAGVIALTVAGGDERPAPEPTPTPRAEATPSPTATATPEPTPAPPPPLWEQLETRGKNLAVGITEPNPNLVSTSDQIPEPFARWRTALGRIDPAIYRLILYWPAIQPLAEVAPDYDAINGGCLRDKLPCAPYRGVRDQLRALATRQREGGWEALVVVTGTPDWAARPPSGCERSRTGSSNRLPRTDALPAYRRLVRGTLALAAPGGRHAALLGAVERAQPPVLVLAAARVLLGRRAERLDRPVRRDRALAAPRAGGAPPATSATCSASSRRWSAGCRSRPP